MTIEVTISERALASMVLAACEAYAFGQDDDWEAVETYAHLWGFRRCSPDGGTEHVHVDRISACVSAQVANDRATVFTDMIPLQDDIVKHWSPHGCESRMVVFSRSGFEFCESGSRASFGTAVGGLSGAFARRWRSRLRQAPSNRPDFTSERKPGTAWPPSAPQRWPQRFIRCCTRFLLLDSTVS